MNVKLKSKLRNGYCETAGGSSTAAWRHRAVLFLSEYSTLIKGAGLLVIAGAAVAIALQTASGRRIWEFAASRNEVRKVVWPSRQETVRRPDRVCDGAGDGDYALAV